MSNKVTVTPDGAISVKYGGRVSKLWFTVCKSWGIHTVFATKAEAVKDAKSCDGNDGCGPHDIVMFKPDPLPSRANSGEAK